MTLIVTIRIVRIACLMEYVEHTTQSIAMNSRAELEMVTVIPERVHPLLSAELTIFWNIILFSLIAITYKVVKCVLKVPTCNKISIFD